MLIGPRHGTAVGRVHSDMLELTRTVRFAINDAPTTASYERVESGSERAGNKAGNTRGGWNTFAGAPSMQGLGRHYEIDVTCRGDADPVTGYFINIREIDQAVRIAAVPIIEQACRENPWVDPALVLPGLIEPIERALSARASHELHGVPKAGNRCVEERPRLVSRVRWRLSPYYSVEMSSQDANVVVSRSSASKCGNAGGAGDVVSVVLMRQQFEFAASHRLHSPLLTDEENRALYGKCTHPSGHGHNYRVEPCVAVPVGRSGENGGTTPFTLIDLERITNERVIQRFDHKHLNLDTDEFACGASSSEPSSARRVGAPVAVPLNPSVENIAKVCFDLLAPAILDTHTGAALRSVTVWETDKTSCTYPG